MLEKPFGENLAEATELNTLLSQVTTEEQVFRVDHFPVACTVTRNLMCCDSASSQRASLWK